MTDTEAGTGERVADAWARIEAALGRVLPGSLPQLAPPADVPAIDAVETALGVTLPADFRASLRVHNGTGWMSPGAGGPSPVPLEWLYDTARLIEMTRMWRDNHAADPDWDDPQVWAYLVDRGEMCLNGPVRPIVGSSGAVPVGDMNGDVLWFLDLDPAPGGTPGQVVRVDVECAAWDVLAPSWTGLLTRYAHDLERYATDPADSPLAISQDLGPQCEWGSTPANAWGNRPTWLQDIRAREP